MPPVIRHLFSMLLAGVVVLALLGTTPPATTCTDSVNGEAQDIHSGGDTGNSAGGDTAAVVAVTASPLRAARITAAFTVPSLWTACTVHPGHWPQAPPA